MGDFNSAWIIATAIGVILVAVDFIIPEENRKSIGWALLSVGLLMLIVGVGGIGFDLYKKFTKPAAQNATTQHPQVAPRPGPSAAELARELAKLIPQPPPRNIHHVPLSDSVGASDKIQQQKSSPPEVIVVYRDKKIEIYNQGTTSLYLCSGFAYGTAILPLQEKDEPRVIAPGAFYYLFAGEMEGQFLAGLGFNGQGAVPMHFFLETEDITKYTVRGELLGKVADGKVTIHPQIFPPVRGWTNEAPAGTFITLPGSKPEAQN